MEIDQETTRPEAQASAEKRRIFEGVRRTWLIALAALLVLCLTVSWRTRDAMEHLPFLRGGSASQAGSTPKSLVDLQTWQTAQALAPLAVSAEEVELAREAERLADHETDQAFAAALRLAAPQHRVLSARAQELTKRTADLQVAVADDQKQLKAATAAAPVGEAGSAHHIAGVSAVGDEAAIATAQLGLDEDELKDAQEDLARELGDDRTRIQQELSAHEAAMQKYDAQARETGQVAVISARRNGTLAGRVSSWQSQRSRRDLLKQAEQATRRGVLALMAQHDGLEKQADRTNTAAQSSDQSGVGLAGDARLNDLRQRSAQRQLLSIFDDRIATVQQLAAIYAKWSDQVALQHRIVGHLLMQSAAEVILILIAMLLGGALVRHLLARPNLDRGRMQTLRTVLSLAIQVVGIVAILLVIFGAPKQTPTILGLTTAGLTVVLQDFILAFFGWFVLMGKNGISVGDAVEIDGVSGNVVDIGLFRTTMLETGNWTAQGHPTGRRVAIINKFAINGQYFNYSTAGQWLWDEITIAVGALDDPYGRVKAIKAAVIEETKEGAQRAEQEWQRSDRLHGPSQFTSEPEVNLRPGAGGMEMVLRYVTRASERVETRNRLYQRVLLVLRGNGADAEMAGSGSDIEVAKPSRPMA